MRFENASPLVYICLCGENSLELLEVFRNASLAYTSTFETNHSIKSQP